MLPFSLDYTLQIVALGSALLGIVSGALGSFAVLRKQSLLGDAISHAALPGIALAFLLTGSKAPLVLVLGAALAGWLGTLAVLGIVGSTRIKEDSALGIVLAVFFGFGLVLLTWIQKRPDASQAGLDKYLFGQAATLLAGDVVLIAGLGALAIGTMLLCWKEFKLLAFDRDFADSIGMGTRGVDVLLTTTLVIAIVIGLQTVGVVLMSAMVVAPAVAARQWTDRLGRMVALAAAFGATAGVSGALISASAARLPTGPVIVLCLTLLVAVSLLGAPNRGLLWRWLAERRNHRQIRTDATLRDLRALAAQHGDQSHGHTAGVLQAMSFGRGDAARSLAILAERGWARCSPAGEWTLTPDGAHEAERQVEAAPEEES